MSEFDDLTQDLFTNDQLNVIEAAARYEWWYYRASENADRLVNFMLDKGIPPSIMLKVLEETTQDFKEAMETEAGGDE